MLFLKFQIGQDRYVIDCREVIEVLPLLRLKQLPGAPEGVAGAFSYRATPVSVIDLSALAVGTPAQARLSTRIVVVRYPDGHGGWRALGLIAEKATRTLQLAAEDFRPAGVAMAGAPYLGPVHSSEDGLLQWVEVSALLPESLREALFAQVAEAQP